MSLWVKICGVRREEDARAAVAAGASAIGLNFFPGSRRFISRERARAVADAVRGQVTLVGVFVDASPEEIEAADSEVGLDLYQLHGGEPPETVARWPGKAYKALRIATRADLAQLTRYPGPRYLLDTKVVGTFGGTGQTFDWTLAAGAGDHGEIVLAGGLTPDNVAEAVRIARPFGVDTAGGVESAPGVKDAGLLAAFVRAARGA